MPGVDPGVPVYPIGVVQRLTGLSARQIRYYEKEGLLAPSRTRGNRRLFSAADVERLRQVKSLLEQGLNLEGVRAYLASLEAARTQRPAAAAPAGVAPAATGPEADIEPARGVSSAARGAAGEPAPVTAAAADDDQEEPIHPAIFKQARGRRLSSLFPVDQQAELVRLLQRQREQQQHREAIISSEES